MAAPDEPGRPRKAGHGEDSIYWDKSKNRYIGAISLGYTPAGKRRRPKVSGKTKAEVKRKIRERRKALEAGLKTPTNYTVEQTVAAWLSQGLKGRGDGSIDTYRILADTHITPYLGKAKLGELEADELDEWLEGRAAVLATQSLRMVLSVLRRSITHAQRRGKVARNVSEWVEAPEGQPGRPSKSLLLEQAQAVLCARQGTWIHAYVVLSLLVGVRVEEARPLTWRHVHTEPDGDLAPHVDVWRSVRHHGDTKTRKSRRSLAMPKQAASVIAEHRLRQQQEYRKAEKEWSEDELVFPADGGGRRSALNIRRNLRALLKDAGFPNPHEWTTRELRTSTVSLLSDHGIPIEIIARVVGHSGTSITERVYRKQIRPVITEGAEAMDDIFTDDRQPDGGEPSESA